MFSNKKNKKVEVVAPAAPSTPPVEMTVERSILKDCVAAVVEAKTAVSQRESECERLQGIIAEGEKSEERLASAIGGEIGLGPDDALMRSSVALEISARAAKIRLPRAQAELEAAKAAAMHAEAQRNIASRNVLLVEATKLAMQHREHWRELCRLNDILLGISAALPPLDPISEPIHDQSMPLEVRSSKLARFGRHIPDETEIATARARWSAANAALLDDPAVDLRKAIDRLVELPAPSSLPPGMTRSTKPADHVDAGLPTGSFGLPFLLAR